MCSVKSGCKSWKELRAVSLRFKLAVGGILILLVPLTVVGVYSYTRSAQALEKIARMKLVQVSRSLSSVVQMSLEKNLRQLTVIAENPKIIRDAERGTFERSIKRLRMLYPLLRGDFEGLAIYDMSGVVRADGADPARVGTSGADPDYLQIVQAGNPGVGHLFYSEATGSPVFFLDVPIRSSAGRIVGLVRGTVRVDSLVEYIGSVDLGKTGTVFMIDPSGMFIALGNRQDVRAENIYDVPELSVLAEKMMAQQTAAVEYTYDGHSKFAGICPVPMTRWSIGATQYKKEIMHVASSNMHFLLMVAGLSMGSVSLMVFFFSKSVSAPVQTQLDSLSHAVNQAAEAFFLVGCDGIVQFANPAAAAIMGRPADALVGCSFADLISSGFDAGDVQGRFDKVSGWSGRVEGCRDDGCSYTLEFTVSPVSGSANKPMCHLVVGRDVTQELSMQEQLRQSQKMEAIGTLAGGIAHDFNNILGGILGFAELALLDMQDPKRVEEYLNEVLRSSRRARDLVSHILTFSRRGSPGREPVILKYVVRDAGNLLRASLPVTIDIEVSLHSSAAILGNATQIHQIIMNLGTNAGYEMRDTGGRLSITLDELEDDDVHRLRYSDLKEESYLLLTVSDTGGGIPEGIRDRLFEPFYTTKPPGQGTGLGLSMVHGIVNGMEGRISVDSEVGEGTSFRILLPVIKSVTADPAAEENPELARGTERLLIVDDEVSITNVLKRLMPRLGYSVQVFNDSTEAWEAFSEAPDTFDLILTDCTMPRITGIDFSEKIRGIRSDVPIIMCSGNLARNESLDELHPIELMEKPVSAGKISETVRRMLDGNKKVPLGE